MQNFFFFYNYKKKKKTYHKWQVFCKKNMKQTKHICLQKKKKYETNANYNTLEIEHSIMGIRVKANN